MSFGEGNLRTAVAELTDEKRELEARIDKLMTLNGELCVEVNAKDKQIRELESTVRDMADYIDGILNRRYTINVSFGRKLLERAQEVAHV